MSHEHVHQALHEAITNKNNEELIRIVARHSNEDLQLIAEAYVKHYGKALPEAIKDAALGEYATLLIDLVIPRASFAARTIHNAISGAGTKESAIIDVVVHESKHQLDAIKAAYSNLFSRDLTAAIASDLSGHFKQAVVALLERKDTGAVGNPETEAENLYKKGEGKWGTDDDYFVQFFTQHSFESLLAIDQAYTAKYNHSLETAIQKETSGDYQSILRALVVPREVYWARRIRHAIAGLGTDDHLLRRAFTLNNKDQLRRIDQVYDNVNPGKSLRKDVADDTSGPYKALFIAILDNL